MMKHYHKEWLVEWCQQNGWTELYIERHQYWAFPPGAVMPEPLPCEALRTIKTEKGLCNPEKWLAACAAVITISSVLLCYLLKSPMPLGLAFAFNAVTVALLEIEL